MFQAQLLISYLFIIYSPPFSPVLNIQLCHHCESPLCCVIHYPAEACALLQ
uniref:Uncharacterized protein n=1 Tax=Anguilla anguilla TaxID=7936 RepID=A0A0E9PHT5_ANGAN